MLTRVPLSVPRVRAHPRIASVLALGTAIAVGATLAGSGAFAAPAAAPGAVTAAAAAAAAPVGPAGPRIVLANGKTVTAYDAATDSSGRSYIGWIANATADAASRTIYLCTLPPGATACAGGIQSTPSLGPDSAEGLKVLVSGAGNVTLVWFHDTSPGSVTGPRGGRIATSTSVQGGPLTAAVDRADAPSFGALYDADLAPDGSIWTVAGLTTTNTIEVRRGLGSAYTPLRAPFLVAASSDTTSGVQLAIDGSQAVLAMQQYGQIAQPVAYTYFSDGVWHAYGTVAHTWTASANIGLTTTTSGVRLLASVDNASYQPVVSRWTGTAFGPRTPTGDTDSCGANSHDPVADASGRMADVSWECSNLAVANFANTTRATTFRFAGGGTPGGPDPQITTTPRGHGWVAWSILSGSSGVLLRVQAINLAAPAQKVVKKVAGGKLTLVGPATCMPAVDFTIKSKAKAKRGWKAGAVKVKLGRAKVTRTINGAALTPGATYKLKAKAKFTASGSKGKAKANLVFRTCPAP